MKLNINNSKYLIVGIISGVSFLALSTYASTMGAGTIGSLFEKIGVSYKLIGTNIKDETIETTQILDGQVMNSDLASNSVNSIKIENLSVSLNDLSPNSVNSSKVVDGSIALVDLAPNSVNSSKVVNLSLVLNDLAPNSVNSSKVVDFSLVLNDLAPNSVNSSKVVNSSIALIDLAPNSVNSSKVVNSSIALIDLAPNSVNSSKVLDDSLTSFDLGVNSVGNSELIDSPTFTTVYASQYNVNSDRRYKDNVIELTNSLSNILKLNGYSYTLKENGKKDIGIIAQEVEIIYPELVNTGDDGYKSVQYINMIAPIIEAIKEQQDMIDSLRKEIEVLKIK